jgi:glucokinase
MENYFALVFDIGGTNIRGAIVDSAGTIASRLTEPTGTAPLDTLLNIAAKLLADASSEIAGIGVAAAGIIDHQTGTILRSPNIPALTNTAPAILLQERLGMKAHIVNDANAAALGEKWLGSGSIFHNFVLLSLGTGIGCGVILQDELLPIAAEAGHMSIANDGPTCGCGNVGCLEQFASASAIISNAVAELQKGTPSILRNLYQGNFYKMTSKDIYEAALEGDALARSVLRDAGRSLGIGIASLVNLFSPEAVIVTGGLTGAWKIYGEAASAEASRRAMPELFRRCQIIVSPVFDDAGLFGAAQMVFQKRIVKDDIR